MGKFQDLTNQKFNYLTAIKYEGNSKWLWKCDCGKQKIISAYDVKTGKTKSCGCFRSTQLINRNHQNSHNLINQKFGKLTVIERVANQRKRTVWLCKCECGNFKTVVSADLLNGDTKSCGCLKGSYAESLISKILTQNYISFKKEYSFPDLTSTNNIPLRFDFAIFKENTLQCLIEYDGEQHYLKKTDLIFSDTLENRQYKDNQKNNYCLKNNIPLYRIPYWNKNNISIETLFDKKYLIQGE